MNEGKRSHTSIAMVFLGACLLFMLSQVRDIQPVVAQQPAQQSKTAEQVFKNIKVLKSMPAGELQNGMFFISAALGVDCSYCHTPPAMEKDDKPSKETARRMLAMVSEINQNFGNKPVVSCATCHQGRPKPTAITPLPSLNSLRAANASTPNQATLPTVDEILDRYVKALGGTAALGKMTTRTRKGSIDLPGSHGTFELYETAPNKWLMISSLPPPLGSVQQGIDGTKGWVKSPKGIFDISGEQLVQSAREWSFYGDVKLKEQFKSMQVAGKESLDGRDFYVLEGVRPDGRVERIYFDVRTGLLARRAWQTPTYFGPLAAANDYDDYRKVGSVWLPFVIRKQRGENFALQRITEYRLNVMIDDAKFQKPAPPK